MKLTLTFTNSNHTCTKDIQVNDQQKIIDTLTILQEAGIDWQIPIEKCRMKSGRQGVYLDITKSYQEQNVYNGDILELI